MTTLNQQSNKFVYKERQSTDPAYKLGWQKTGTWHAAIRHKVEGGGGCSCLWTVGSAAKQKGGPFGEMEKHTTSESLERSELASSRATCVGQTSEQNKNTYIPNFVFFATFLAY